MGKAKDAIIGEIVFFHTEEGVDNEYIPFFNTPDITGKSGCDEVADAIRLGRQPHKDFGVYLFTQVLTPEQVSDIKGQIKDIYLKEAKRLWADLEDVPVSETECLEIEWNGFPVGTFREDIWKWFEETYDVSVAVDLMGV